VQSLVESGHLTGARGAYRLTTAVEALEVPASVQAVLAARIDRLPEREKQVLQTAAVIGKTFSEALLGRVAMSAATIGETELSAALSALVAAEFLYEAALYPQLQYSFKHPLTQEVAYGSLLIERRKEVHERTARQIETLFTSRLEDHYGDLAHHYSCSANRQKAVEYLQLAAQQAVQRMRRRSTT
jgi:predicted ATPase